MAPLVDGDTPFGTRRKPTGRVEELDCLQRRVRLASGGLHGGEGKEEHKKHIELDPLCAQRFQTQILAFLSKSGARFVVEIASKAGR